MFKHETFFTRWEQTGGGVWYMCGWDRLEMRLGE